MLAVLPPASWWQISWRASSGSGVETSQDATVAARVAARACKDEREFAVVVTRRPALPLRDAALEAGPAAEDARLLRLSAAELRRAGAALDSEAAAVLPVLARCDEVRSLFQPSDTLPARRVGAGALEEGDGWHLYLCASEAVVL